MVISTLRPAAFLIMIATVAGADAAIITTFTPGTIFDTPAISGAATNGADMEGMTVTANFVGGGTETLTWTATSATAGGVVGTFGSGWSLTVDGDTHPLDGPGVWILTNDSGSALSSFEIVATDGQIAFDRSIGLNGLSEATPGSARGHTFSQFSNSSLDWDLTGGQADGDAEVTYTNEITVLGSPAPNSTPDLYGTLNVVLNGALPTNRILSFRADTDLIGTKADPNAIPEPGSFAVVGLICAVAAVRVARKKKAVESDTEEEAEF